MTDFKEKSAEEIQQTDGFQQAVPQVQSAAGGEMKFCKHCGQQIPKDAVLCVHCGRQVEELNGGAAQSPNIVINNSNSNVNTNTANAGIPVGALKREKNKWVAILLCLFLGVFGGHKFYEGKIGMGILYIFTVGVFGIGAFIDLIVLLFKPNPYYV